MLLLLHLIQLCTTNFENRLLALDISINLYHLHIMKIDNDCNENSTYYCSCEGHPQKNICFVNSRILHKRGLILELKSSSFFFVDLLFVALWITKKEKLAITEEMSEDMTRMARWRKKYG